MKKILSASLILALSLSVYAAEVKGTSSVYKVQNDLVLVIEGDAAKKLYDSMSEVQITNLDRQSSEKIGEQLSCIKNKLNRASPSFRCELFIEGKRGAIGVGHEG